jgi:prevent-host-death family protein
MGATGATIDPGGKTVGVRELRQRASELLDEVTAGRTVTVTRHGRAVARLVAVVQPGDPLEAMVRTGTATRAEDTGDLLDVVGAEPVGDSLPSAALAQLRDEERW